MFNEKIKNKYLEDISEKGSDRVRLTHSLFNTIAETEKNMMCY